VNTVPDAALVGFSLLGTGLVCGVRGRFRESPELRTSLPMRCHGVSGPGGRHTYLGAPAAPSPGTTVLKSPPVLNHQTEPMRPHQHTG
jgi:hypothetical protein